MIRLFCVTVYVFDETGQRSLFLRHKKLGKWLPPGGKIDSNEIPDDAAIRETLEETGLQVRLLGENPEVKGGCVRPYGVQVNTIKPGELEHIDLIYLAVPIDDAELRVSEREADGLEWLPIERILHPDFDTFNDVKIWTQRFAREMEHLI